MMAPAEAVRPKLDWCSIERRPGGYKIGGERQTGTILSPVPRRGSLIIGQVHRIPFSIMPESLVKLCDFPPVWLVAGMALTWIAGWALPATVIDVAIVDSTGFVMMGSGVALMIWCGLLFRHHRTSIIPRKTPDSMITDGPYRFSRNPIYLADAIILTGWIMVVGSPVALITLPAFIMVINRRFIASEEAVLTQQFGDEFSKWSSRVRRWI